MSLDGTTASKNETRRELADLPYDEKLQIVESLRDNLLVDLQELRKAGTSNHHEADTNPESILLSAIGDTAKGADLRASTVDDSKLSCEVDRLAKSREVCLYALRQLFPSGVPVSEEFWSRLSNLQLRLGWGDTSHRAVGSLIQCAAESLGPREGEALLRKIIELRGPHFFQALSSLLVALRELKLRPEFAAEWFPSLLRRIGNDLAVGEFWNAVRTFCEYDPRTAIRTLQVLRRATSEDEISVASYILGSLRCVELADPEVQTLVAVENEVADDAAAAGRAIYHRSWVPSAWCGKLTAETLRLVVERMSGTTAAEREQLFWLLGRVLLSPSLPEDARSFGRSWLHDHAGSSIPDGAKYNVIEYASRLAADQHQEAVDLVLAVQPIQAEHKGTWKLLESLLVKLLKGDMTLFKRCLAQLARLNANNFRVVLEDGRAFEWLLSEMRTAALGDVVAQLLLDPSSECRVLAITLFDKLLVSLPSSVSEGSDELYIALLFYEIQRSLVHATALARLLIFLLPGVSKSSLALRDELRAEILLQLKNYPGGCKEEFSSRAQEFPLLAQAIAEADKYFASLETAQPSVARIEVPGYERAARINARRFASQVAKGSEENSIFTHLVKKVHLLYGKQWRTFYGGQMGESSGLREFSTSVEFPRMELIDPEGMQMRRLHASFRIRELTDSSSSKAKE